MQWVASTLHTTSENGVSSITTADALSRLRSLVALIEAVFPFPPSPSLPAMLDSRDWIP